MSEETKQAENNGYKCSACGGELNFVPGTNSLKCKYCGTQNEISQKETANPLEETPYLSFLKNMVSGSEMVERSVVKCSSCTAEITLKPNVTADDCPFCGTALVLKSGTTCTQIKPRSILPFKIKQSDSHQAMKNWISGLWFAPSALKNIAVNNKLKGIYIPYFTYDCSTNTDYSGERGDDYQVQENYTTVENGKTVHKTRTVTKTRWTDKDGNVSNRFDDVLIMASHSLPKEYANNLEPWELKSLVPFDENYLSGFQAESYQTSLEKGFEEAKEIMNRVIENTIKSDIGGDHQKIHNYNVQHNNITFKHILLPIWVNSYKFNNKTYTVLINGRTGEVQGERPYSVGKIIMAVLAALGVGYLIYWAITMQ